MINLYRLLAADCDRTIRETPLAWEGKVDLRLDDNGGLITECEAAVLVGLVIAMQPTVIAEVGSGGGRSLAALLEGARASEGLTGRATELWSCEVAIQPAADCRKLFCGLRPTIVTGDVDAMLEQMPAPPDFAFIDGDHTTVGVTRDFQALHAAMAPGSLIVFHDSRSIPEVQQFCRTIGALLLPTFQGLALWRKP